LLVTNTARPFKRSALVGYAALLAVAVLSLFGRLVAAHNQGNSWIDVLSVFGLMVVGILLFVLLLFVLFDWRNRVRVQTLSAMNPTAFVAIVATDPTLVSQVDEFAVKLTGRRSGVRVSSYETLVADRSSIRIFSGSRKPREVVSFPTSMLARTSIGSSQAGARMIPCLDVFLHDDKGITRLSIHLIRSVPRFVRGEHLDAALKAFREVTASTG